MKKRNQGRANSSVGIYIYRTWLPCGWEAAKRSPDSSCFVKQNSTRRILIRPTWYREKVNNNRRRHPDPGLKAESWEKQMMGEGMGTITEIGTKAKCRHLKN